MYQARPLPQYLDLDDERLDFRAEAPPAADGPQHHVLENDDMAAAEPVDRTAEYLAEVLKLIPNVQVEHAEKLVKV